jgi:opacity protein-like surface antigen
MKKHLLLASASLLIAQGAMASEWDGLYAGLGVSQNRLNTTWTDVDYDNHGNTREQRHEDLSPSVFVGYNTSSDALVYGVELEYQMQDTEQSRNDSDALVTDTFDSTLALKLKGGMAVGQALLYITAGVVDGDISHERLNAADSIPEFDQDSYGYLFGAGLQAKLADSLSVRIELTDTRFAETSERDGSGDKYRVGDSISSVSIGAAYQF